MADKVLLSLGEKVDVYKQGDQAVKIFKKDYPKTEVLYEALVQARVEETGLPVPKINEIAKNDGVWNLFMDHIEGKTMAEIMKEDPANIKNMWKKWLISSWKSIQRQAPCSTSSKISSSLR